MIVVARSLLALMFFVLTAGAAEAKKIALVIGNGAYRNAVQLQNPVNDGRAMGAKLRSLGFDVVDGFDQDYVAMQATVNSFARQAVGADIALLFYAGHGMQVRGENYIIPVDAAFKDETSLDFEAIPINFIIRQMSRDVRLRMVFLDACRDNPLARSLAGSMNPSRSAGVSSGLAEIKIDDPGEGTVIAFATSPGDVAYDGQSEHSPFTQALLAHIDEPDLPLQNVMTRVTRDVFEATNRKQRPWFNASLIGEVYLNKTPPRAADVSPEEAAATPSPDLPVRPNLTIANAEAPDKSDPIAWDQEKALFEAAEKSGAPEDFEIYMSSYPKGHFASIARNLIQRSRSMAAAPSDADGLTPRRPLGTDAAAETGGTADVRVAALSGTADVRAAAVSEAVAPSPSPGLGTEVTEAVLGWDRAARREVQQRLVLDGAPLGRPDGEFGPKTRQAILAWQALQGMQPTGYFDAAQYRHLVGKTAQSYALWTLEDQKRQRTETAKKPTVRKQQASARQPAARRTTQKREPRAGVLVGRRESAADAAGAAFVGGLIGGAIGGALGR